MKVRLNVDTVGYKEKPTDKEEIKKIRTRLCKSERIIEIDISQLKKAIQAGYAFTPAAMTGTKGITWQSQQIICADIDNDVEVLDENGEKVKDPATGNTMKKCIDNPLTPEDAKNAMKEHGITPAFMYYSFRNKPDWPKYRIVLILDEPLTDPEQALDFTRRFTGMFNKARAGCADTVIKDNARLFFGGKPDCVFYETESTTKAETLQALPVVEGKKKSKTAKASEKPAPVKMQKKSVAKKKNFDIEGWMQKFGIQYTAERDDAEGYMKYVLAECPFDSSHKAPDSMITLSDTGKIGFFCFHNSCEGKTWRDVRMKYEPDAYNTPWAHFDYNKEGEPYQSISNVVQVLKYDEKLKGRIYHNEMADAPWIAGALPWVHVGDSIEWNNNDDANLWGYIESKYTLKSREKIQAALQIVAHRTVRNPVKEILEKAHNEWDGNRYVDRLLPMFLGAEQSDYNTFVIRLFMLAAVARVYHPGCKFDYMLILTGEQGRFKSSFLRFLSIDDEWFDDNFSTFNGKEPFEKLRGRWMVEMAELKAIKAERDIETVKAFITSTTDIYRTPYDKRAQMHKRRCVLAGTSNPGAFLKDPTGNRRFLIVKCGIYPATNPNVNPEETRRFMLQAWGEIMDEFKRSGENPPLYLPDNFVKFQECQQEEFTDEDPDKGIIQEWLENHPEKPFVCAVQLWHEALSHPLYEEHKVGEMRRINDIMRNLQGWQAIGKKRFEPWGLQRAYKRTDEIIVDAPGEAPFDDE